MNFDDLENKIAKDLAVELHDEFDRNFERKGFFNEKWPDTKLANNRGSLMNRTGALRRSIIYNVRENIVMFSSSLPYASVHNEGGEIIVTVKMKKYFWAMYYQAIGARSTTKVKGEISKSKRNQKLTAEAEKWKSLALMPVGHKIKVEKRQFIGNHPEVVKIVKGVIDRNMEEFNQEQIKIFKR